MRTLAAQLTELVEQLDKQVHYYKTLSEQLAHEIAILKHHKFAPRSEQLSPDQISLLEARPSMDLR